MILLLKGFVRAHTRRHPKTGQPIAVRAYRNSKPVPESEQEWIGVDLDKTLAHHGTGRGEIGEPIKPMLARVKRWIREGKRVKIFTARAEFPEEIQKIHDWLQRHGLPKLDVTNRKDQYCAAIWDDKAISIRPNTGMRKSTAEVVVPVKGSTRRTRSGKIVTVKPYQAKRKKAQKPAKPMREGSGIRTIGAEVAGHWRDPDVAMRGQTIASPKDLARLAQPFRNPHYEVLRFFLVDDNNRIVSHEAVTAHDPGSVPFPYSGIFGFMDVLKVRMKRAKASGYYMLHNHPSGNPRPSRQDIMATEEFIKRLPGFRGHVVIDHGSASIMAIGWNDSALTVNVEMVEIDNENLRKHLAREHPLIGTSLANSDDLAALGRALHLKKDTIVLVYRSRGMATAIQEVPAKFFINHPNQFRRYLRKTKPYFGAQECMAYFPRSLDEWLLQEAKKVAVKLAARKVILDAVAHDGYSARAEAIINPPRIYGFKEEPESKHYVAKSIAFRTTFQGIPIAIENPSGSVRHWIDDATGERGSTLMQYDYGYCVGTRGLDDSTCDSKKEGIDCFIGPDPNAKEVFVVTQMKKPDFTMVDEDKVMLGFPSAEDAIEAYLSHFDDPRFLGRVQRLSIEEFKRKLAQRKEHRHPIVGGEPIVGQ